ncbi:hypothetical protein AXF42_Ash012991 [Apostasia shenzhenica]|uniref:NAB domain-containing protein n=1 Tax=Apostasia shenzhenica TaxID=1088818 RepID=A0A2I0ARU3_9ASPA|nr:hypothetical protein AXF42_Ash012991 [Apostasia shenzhenica]
MSTTMPAESRRLYSWWWDSHISPKNSKWLQENLADMDVKVKAMIKLIEEDADSFAKRAEMYYKKRPELLKFMEEFYRAYRALAERYDHATSALRHAHQSMAEAFPNHIPLALPDDPVASSVTNSGHRASDLPSPVYALIDHDILHKDENMKGELARVKLPEKKARKSLNFQEEEEKVLYTRKENVKSEIKHLEGSVSKLSMENQNLKSQIVSESKHLDLNRAEVQSLRDEISRLESEKEAAISQNQLSQESINSLETEISKAKDEIRKLIEEMMILIEKLSRAEKENQCLQVELEERKRVLEMSLKSSEQLHNESQEKFKLMALEIQTHVEKLQEFEHSKAVLEEELHHFKDNNSSLNKQNLACALKIKELQDEMIALKEMHRKLEDEVEIFSKDKMVLQQELKSTKTDRNELDLKHKTLSEQILEARSNVESLEVMVKELRQGNSELKEGCRMLEDENVLLLNKLKSMELDLSERNVVLENSLSDANVELEELRDKAKLLEDSFNSLNTELSTHVEEKAALASQIEALVENVKKLSEKNILMENSLADANSEVDGVRSKLREMEESCQTLSIENSELHDHKKDLISQVESIQLILANLERRHATLEEKHINLAKENGKSIKTVKELEDSLCVKQKSYESLRQSCSIHLNTLEKEIEMTQEECMSNMNESFILQRCLWDMADSLLMEKKKYKCFVQLSDFQKASLDNQVLLLQEERKALQNRVHEEEQRTMDSMLETFILQRCLSEVEQKNFILLQECQKHVVASRCLNEQIIELEGRDLIQKEKIALSAKHNANIRDGINLLLNSLSISNELMNTDTSDVVNLKSILNEVKSLLAFISNVNDENQLLCMEISIYCTILKQIGLEGLLLDQELGTRNSQLLALQSKQHELFQRYEQLRHYVCVKQHRENALMAELGSLNSHLAVLSEEYRELEDKNNALEEENCLIFAKAMNIEHLYLLYRAQYAESTLQLDMSTDEFCALLAVKSDLDEEIKRSKAKMTKFENENKHLNESLLFLDGMRSKIAISEFDLVATQNLCEELFSQVDISENLLKEKNMQLSKANHELQCKQKESAELCRRLVVANKTVDEAKMMISALEKISAGKDKEIASAYEENKRFNVELDKSNSEVEAHRMREEILCSELQKKMVEHDRFEGEIAELFNEVFVLAINVAVLEEKMLELNIEITQRSARAVELEKKLGDVEKENSKIKANLNAYLPLSVSLGNAIEDVEEHAFQLANLHGKQDSSASKEQRNYHSSIGDYTSIAGILELQNLIAKLEALQKLLIGTKNHLDEEKVESSANLESARREIEDLKLKYSIHRESGREDQTAGINEEMKDIELVVEKEVGVDKLATSTEIKESQEDWGRRMIDILSSYSEKLFALHTSAQDLRRKMEASGKKMSYKSLDLHSVNADLKQAEEAINDLFDSIIKLTTKVEEYSKSVNGRREVLEKTRRIAERIGMLELEMEKIHYIFLKLEDECEIYNIRAGVANRAPPRTLLRDYLYGRSGRPARKRERFLAWMRHWRKASGY